MGRCGEREEGIPPDADQSRRGLSHYPAQREPKHLPRGLPLCAPSVEPCPFAQPNSPASHSLAISPPPEPKRPVHISTCPATPEPQRSVLLSTLLEPKHLPRGLPLCAPSVEPCPFAQPNSPASHSLAISPPPEPKRPVHISTCPATPSHRPHLPQSRRGPFPYSFLLLPTPTTSLPQSPPPLPQPQPLLSLPPPPKPASVQPYGHAAHGITRRPRPPLGRVGSLPR